MFIIKVALENKKTSKSNGKPTHLTTLNFALFKARMFVESFPCTTRFITMAHEQYLLTLVICWSSE